MASKKSLETLFDILCEREHTNSEHNFWLKLYNDIEKNLEMLEIIKKYYDIDLFYAFLFNEYLLSFTEKTKTENTFDTSISKEDAEKIAKYFDYLDDNSKDKETTDNDK